jgi:hypothetical protein
MTMLQDPAFYIYTLVRHNKQLVKKQSSSFDKRYDMSYNCLLVRTYKLII